MKSLQLTLLLLVAFSFASCTKEPTMTEGPPEGTARVPGTMWLSTAPEGAVSPHSLRETGTLGEVVVVGRVGGGKSAFTENRAMFTLVDSELDPCPDEEGCPTPWDYCCYDPRDIHHASVTVEVHEGGRMMKVGVKDDHGLDHLKTVTVKGTLTKDDSDNYILVASGIHVGN